MQTFQLTKVALYEIANIGDDRHAHNVEISQVMLT